MLTTILRGPCPYTCQFVGVFVSHLDDGNPPLTPAWALECWLWEDDKNTAAYEDSLLSWELSN
ncbi:hypothetical protein [Runella sp. SP2]|uniref:hypothetical protein n=1 Tax=Runella sp. SP2 TaxID=2268026 RepID=UPI0013DD98FA|nr:hypothetical protein [Runella sp. SP2]